MISVEFVVRSNFHRVMHERNIFTIGTYVGYEVNSGNELAKSAKKHRYLKSFKYETKERLLLKWEISKRENIVPKY